MNRGSGLRGRGLAAVILAALAWFGGHEISVLVSLVAFSGGLWIFLEVADEVIEGETDSIDRALLLALRTGEGHADPIGPGWIEEVGRDFTALGGTGVLTFVTLAVVGYLLLASRQRIALFTVTAVAGGLLISTLLKLAFDRTRPDLVPHEAVIYTASFPSGHSMMAAVTYLTLAAILTRVHHSRLLKAYLLIVAASLALLIGVSRVYLGVHWPTDVVAGWSAGAAWAAFCWLAARWLQRRKVVEDDEETPLQNDSA
jgi:undecaprenyl-diphosphatase